MYTVHRIINNPLSLPYLADKKILNISKDELFLGMNSMKKSKSLDIDGPSCKFLKVCGDHTLGDDLLQMAREAFPSDHLLEFDYAS